MLAGCVHFGGLHYGSNYIAKANKKLGRESWLDTKGSETNGPTKPRSNEKKARKKRRMSTLCLLPSLAWHLVGFGAQSNNEILALPYLDGAMEWLDDGRWLHRQCWQLQCRWRQVTSMKRHGSWNLMSPRSQAFGDASDPDLSFKTLTSSFSSSKREKLAIQ